MTLLSIIAAFAIGLLIGLRKNLSKTVGLCNECKHYKAECIECMASRATYE